MLIQHTVVFCLVLGLSNTVCAVVAYFNDTLWHALTDPARIAVRALC